MLKLLFFLALAALSADTLAQVRISGRVYDFSQSHPLEAVSVLTSSGGGTVTDSLGRYSIIVHETDSVWFSYLTRSTPKYPVTAIGNVQNFEVALHVNITELKEVQVMPRNYRMDSMQNRLDYAKAFNFQKPGIGTSLNTGPNYGAGLDLDEFINMFRFQRNRRMKAFQNRLLEEETQRFIDYKFNRALIIRLTQLRGADLDSFIETYRPTREFVETSTDYELQDYIKKCFSHYQRYKNLMNQLKNK